MPTFAESMSLGTGGSLLLGAAPRGDGLDALVAAFGDGPGAGAVLGRVLLLAAGAVVAGAGLARLVPEIPAAATRAERTVGWVAAAVVVVITAAFALLADVSRLGTAVQVLLALAVPALLGTRWVALPAVPLAVLLGVQLAGGRHGLEVLPDLGYTGAVALLIGLAVYRLTGSATPVRAVVGAAAVATAAAVVQLLLTGPGTAAELFGTGYGLVGLAAAALPLLGALAWLGAARPAADGAPARVQGRARDLRRFTATVAVAGMGAAALLAVLPPPAPQAQPGQPLLRSVELAGQRLALLVAPMRPGRNLVHLGGGYPLAPEAGAAPATHHGEPALAAPPTVIVGGTATPVLARPGASGGFAVVDLPPGATTLTISSGPVSATVPVDTGDTTSAAPALAGPDGPECASAIIGALLAAAAAPACPSDALDPADAGALRAMVDQLGGHGVTRARLVADASPRAVAAARAVTLATSAAGITLADEPDTVIVVSGWADARAAVAEATSRGSGIYLAPWLLTGGVVTAAQSAVLPLTFGTQEAGPQAYTRLLAATFPGEAPSTAGYLAWAEPAGVSLAARPTLNGAAPVDVPMTSGDGPSHHGSGNPAPWFPGGAVVPIGAPLDLP